MNKPTHLKVLLFSECSCLLWNQKKVQVYILHTNTSIRVECVVNTKTVCRICSESLTYRLIAEQHVNVGHNLHEVVLEELADEGCGEVQAKHLVIFRRMFRHFQDGLEGDCQEETLRGRTNDTGSRFI